MIRTQIQFTEDQMRALRERARREDLSVSEVVRRATEAWLRAEVLPNPAERRQRALAAAGRFASGNRDVATDHDRYLSDALRP